MAIDRAKEYLGCSVDNEKMVSPPLVERAGKMDLVITQCGRRLLIDVVVATVATTDVAEQLRRT